jgi:hypothetical protein
MGGNRDKEWMNLFSKVGLQPTVPRKLLKEYGNRKISCITGFIRSNSGRWIAHSEKQIIIISFRDFTLFAGKGESEYEASHGPNCKTLGGIGGFGTPNTADIIDFFNFKVKEDQILEFSY